MATHTMCRYEQNFSKWQTASRELLQDVQLSFYLPKRPGSFRQALAKLSQIWSGSSDAIFFPVCPMQRLYPTLTWTAEKGALIHIQI